MRKYNFYIESGEIFNLEKLCHKLTNSSPPADRDNLITIFKGFILPCLKAFGDFFMIMETCIYARYNIMNKYVIPPVQTLFGILES